MVDETLFSSLEKPLSQAKEVLILLPAEPNYDRLAAALSLFLSLQAAGKKPTALCATPAKVEASDLVGIDKIKNEPVGRNLIVSVDVEESVDKVSYHLEGQQLKIVIKPKEGYPALDPQKVSFSHAGYQPDLIFLVGLSHLKELKGLIERPEELVRPEITVLLNAGSADSISQYPLVWPAASLAEMAAYFINQMRLPVNQDIADNLYKGIVAGTRTFSSPEVTATTFEAAAFCLRAGAVTHQDQKRPSVKAVLSRPQDAGDGADRRPDKPAETPAGDQKKKRQSASDWFEPKIYNANTRI